MKELERILDFFRGHGFIQGKICLFGRIPVEDHQAKILINSGIPAKELMALFDAELYASQFFGSNGYEINKVAYQEWKNGIKRTCSRYGLEVTWFFEEEEFLKSMKDSQKEMEKKKVSGYIYVIESHGKYKIGKTINIRNRMKKYCTENPDELNMVHAYHSEDMHSEEQRLHIRFMDKRVRGEWFTLSKDDLKYIKSLGNA